jgi:PAS domain S-box-containing protein
VNAKSHQLPGYPRKLLLLSPHPEEETALRTQLHRAEDGKYELSRVASFDALERVHLEEICHAVLLDMRLPKEQVFKSIQLVGKMKSNVALLCLCRNHTELRAYKDVVHLVHDYILVQSLQGNELSTRIMHAIQRKTKEAALLVEQSLLTSLLENVPDNIYFKDLESRFIKVSANMLKCYGYTSEQQLLGKTDFDLFTEEHARTAFEDEQEIIRSGNQIVGKIEKETLTDGKVNWVSSTKIPLRDANGQIIGTMGMSRFVTELKETKDQLANESRLLKTVIQHALAGIFVKDREGRYLIVNRRHANYLGAKSVEDVIGKTLYDFFDHKEADKITTADAEIMRSKQGVENMIGHRQRDMASDLWLLTSKVPLHDKNGECIGLVGISQDITSQKEVENELKTAIHTLKETQLQLIEAEKLKTIGRLAAGVAHEVKNPLAVVSLGVEYLIERLSSEAEFVELLQDIKAATEKANQVVFELLDYSSPHAVSMVPAQLNRVIDKVLTLMRHNFNEAHITVIQDLSPELPLFSMDTPKMEQVFINLFLNAIGSIQDGGELIVHTHTQRMQQAGSNASGKLSELFRIGDQIITVEVKDTGHGIKAEEKDKLFDPFFSTKSTGKGTGLGLSVTRSIVEMHRGMITLENREDAPGTLVRLFFPIHKNHET